MISDFINEAANKVPMGSRTGRFAANAAENAQDGGSTILMVVYASLATVFAAGNSVVSGVRHLASEYDQGHLENAKGYLHFTAGLISALFGSIVNSKEEMFEPFGGTKFTKKATKKTPLVSAKKPPRKDQIFTRMLG